MKRTQIYLSDELYRDLKKESILRKKSISSIIREKLETYREKDIQTMLTAIERCSGVWKGRRGTVERLIRKMRKERS